MSLLYPILVACVGVASLVSVLTLLFLLAAAALFAGRTRPSRNSGAALRLAVIVPAHDEELMLAETLKSLHAQSYPADRYEIVVVADNCRDRTAEIAGSMGVTVLERTNLAERGKGYALNFAISYLLSSSNVPDGFLIVDADTCVSPELLSAMNDRLASVGEANGLSAWQVRYGVLNSQDGWRAALMTGAFDLVNHVKPMGREMLGLSVGLKGNGMAFSRAVAEQVPWSGGSLTEDLDYGLELARHFQVRVGYAPEATVLAQMPADGTQASSQRARWEEGRARMVRERALPLLLEGLRRRNLLLWDTGWDLVVPPLAELAGLIGAWLLLIALGGATHLLPHASAWAASAGLTVFGLLVYIIAGFRVSNAPPEAYRALIRAPFYACWKFALLLSRGLRRRGSGSTEEWVRTARTPVTPVSPSPPEAPLS